MAINFKLLKEISETPGAPGREKRIREVVLRELHALQLDVTVDYLGNVIALRKCPSKKGTVARKLAVAAHMDEISFMINHIDDDGFARVQPLGGFDPKTLTAQRVIVHGKQDIIGVMGSKPIHIMTPEERNKAPQLKDYFIDFGLPADEVRKVVSVGDVATRERELIRLGNCVNGKSLDNRIAVFVLIEALKKLKSPTVDVYACFTVQEEVGLRGAQVVAHTINPDFGIGLDTTLAVDVPGSPAADHVTKLGKGTAIKYFDGSVIADERMVRFMKKTAEKNKIQWQAEILPAGGTDTGALQRYGKNGSIAGCISIPTRHIHSVVETCHTEDIRQSIDLLRHCMEGLGSFDFNW